MYEAENFIIQLYMALDLFPKARLPILIASVCYREIGRKLIRNDCILGKKEQQLAQLKINLSFKSSYVFIYKPLILKIRN